MSIPKTTDDGRTRLQWIYDELRGQRWTTRQAYEAIRKEGMECSWAAFYQSILRARREGFLELDGEVETSAGGQPAKVYRVADDAERPPDGGRPKSAAEARNRKMERDYRDGLPLQAIADQHGLTRQRVHQILKGRGVEMRERGLSVAELHARVKRLERKVHAMEAMVGEEAH